MMKVFGEVDIGKDGKNKSEYPAWYFETHKEDLEEAVRHKKNQLDNHLVPDTERNLMGRRLKQEEKRLDEINASYPNLTSAEKDDLSKVMKDMGGKISESMFKRSDMERGIADPHEEARRMSTPVVDIKGDKEAEFAKACGINISDNGKITRIDAEKMWKIGRRLQGEISNTEILRRG